MEIDAFFEEILEIFRETEGSRLFEQFIGCIFRDGFHALLYSSISS